jgi:membrane protein required for colicin V production
LAARICGTLRASLSIVAWAAAAFATLYFAPSIAPFVRARMSPLWLGTIIAYGGIFLAVLVPLSFMTFRFSENVKNSPVGVIDRVLGFIFGIVRGLAVIGLAYIIFSLFVPVHEHPRWIRDARTLPLIRESSEVILALVPDQHLEATREPLSARRATRGADQGRHTHKKYGADERRALDHLIETTGSGDGQ